MIFLLKKGRGVWGETLFLFWVLKKSSQNKCIVRPKALKKNFSKKFLSYKDIAGAGI